MSNLQKYSQPHKVAIPSKSGMYYLVHDMEPILNSLQQLKDEIASFAQTLDISIDGHFSKDFIVAKLLQLSAVQRDVV